MEKTDYISVDWRALHVNMKRKIDALKRDLIIKRVETQSKTFLRRMQTRLDVVFLYNAFKHK